VDGWPVGADADAAPGAGGRGSAIRSDPHPIPQVSAEAASLPERPSERQQAYELAESLDRETGALRQTLDAAVARVNDRRQAAATPDGAAEHLTQMVHVLDVHLQAFQWLEAQTERLAGTLRHVDALVGDVGAPIHSMHH